MKLKWYFIILISLTLIFNLPSAEALSLSGKQLSSLVYEPGKIITNHYTVGDTERQIDVTLGGDMIDYVRIKNLEKSEFDLIIDFSKEAPSAGEHIFFINVAESLEESAGVGSRVTVTKRFKVNVYSYEKEIQASLSTPSINEGSTLPFTVSVKSLTYSDINSVKADITFLDLNNKSIKKFTTESKPLLTLGEVSFKDNFDTSPLPSGEYSAFADISYDGKTKRVYSKYNVGTLDVSLTNYTSTVEQGFSDYKLTVKNVWGLELKNVYAKLLIDNTEIGQTPSINLAPWSEGELSSIFKIDLEPAEYKGIITLYFEGESKDVPITLTVISPPSENSSFVPLILSLSLLVIIIITFIIIKKRKNQNEEQ